MEKSPGWIERSVKRVCAMAAGLRVSDEKRDDAERDLLCMQHPTQQRTLARSDLDQLIKRHHELLDLAVGLGLDSWTADSTMWGGDVAPESQAPGVQCTVVRVYGGNVMVSRAMAPSFRRRTHGPTVWQHVAGCMLVDPPELRGMPGIYTAGLWVWR